MRAWLNNQAADTLYLSSVTLAELLFGLAALPQGKRRDMLAQALDGLTVLFKDRILAFDAAAARRYAEPAMTARTRGRCFPTPDGYIASIAAARGFIVATRDEGAF